jgi:hypothetical protein
MLRAARTTGEAPPCPPRRALPRLSVYFMSHRLVRPVPQRTPERGPFVATALSLHQPLSLSLSVFCLSWARIPFQDLLARFQ